MTTVKLRGNKIQSLQVEQTTGEITSINATTAGSANESWQAEPESMSSFMEDTSLHGARFLVAGNVFRRLFWTLALLSSLGFCAFQIYKSFDAFSDWPYNTKITTKTVNKAENLPFPAVTLCNFNQFNRRRFKNHVQKWNNWSTEYVQQKLIIYEQLMASKYSLTNQSFLEHPELTWRYWSENLHYLVLFSHQMEEMLLPSSILNNSCIINDEPCGSKNFTSSYSSLFGQCYTFNSGQTHHPIIKATMAGQLNGLKLLLNIERDSYIANSMNPFVGLTVLVHDQKTFPFIEQFGFAVQPGVRTVCAIKRKKV